MFGWCPEYVPMADFNMERYLGTWYEAERYFTVLEAGSRCVRTNYTKAVDGRVVVNNEITNRLTGIKRVVEGEIRNVVKGAESKLNVKYSTLPVPFETTYSVLDTDYDSYSVVWSCSSIGPLRAQNAWVMTRERLAPGTVLQMAYGVLDKYKVSRTFFVKTDQADCAIAEAAADAAAKKAATEATFFAEKSASPIAEPAPVPVAAPVAVPAIPVAAAPVVATPVVAAAPIAAPLANDPFVPVVNVAQAIVPAEKSADPLPVAAPLAAAAPVAQPVVPAVPIPIAHAEQMAAIAAAAAPAAPAASPILAALPVVAADPIPAAAPAPAAIPAIPAIPEKPLIAEPIKTAEPAKAIIEAPKA